MPLYLILYKKFLGKLQFPLLLFFPDMLHLDKMKHLVILFNLFICYITAEYTLGMNKVIVRSDWSVSVPTMIYVM